LDQRGAPTPGLHEQLRPKAVRSLVRRFSSKTVVAGPCLRWTGHLDRDGYGSISLFQDGLSKQVRAHHAAYFLAHARWPTSEVLRHTCDNPWCVLAEHLAEGTHADNVRDKMTRGRHSNGRRTLTADDALAIRRDPRPAREVAVAYGVQTPMIYKIRRRSAWKHLEGT
jgi:hypothetical protein